MERVQIRPLQVTPQVAAEMLSFSMRTLNELIYRGEIKIIGSGKMRRIAVAELERWQQANSN